VAKFIAGARVSLHTQTLTDQVKVRIPRDELQRSKEAKNLRARRKDSKWFDFSSIRSSFLCFFAVQNWFSPPLLRYCVAALVPVVEHFHRLTCDEAAAHHGVKGWQERVDFLLGATISINMFRSVPLHLSSLVKIVA
jgi:hypothetical protein